MYVPTEKCFSLNSNLGFIILGKLPNHSVSYQMGIIKTLYFTEFVRQNM